MKLVYILLLLGFFKCVLLYKLYNSVPAVELKRQARAGNKRAEVLYKVANYEASLDVFLWLLGTIFGVILITWSARTSWWLATLILVFSAWLMIWAPAPRWQGWAGALSAMTAKFFAGGLSFLNPVFSRAASMFPPAQRVHLHTGLYEQKDLLEFLSRQNRQIDNRIPQSDLAIAQGALSFGDKLVRTIMTPRRKIKIVSAEESVGPLLMDELHKSGHSRFPVSKTKEDAKNATPTIIATLYLKDIVGYEGSGKVKDLARKDVYYINEDSNLRQALSALLKTHHHLLLVVNNFEEIVGVLSIEDVLEQIIGQPIVDEFDNYADLRAVAAKEAKQQHQEEKHQEVPPAQPT